jgi:molecular chaperone GrpE
MRRQRGTPAGSPHGDAEEHPAYEQETLAQREAEEEERAQNLEREELAEEYLPAEPGESPVTPGLLEPEELEPAEGPPLEIGRGELEAAEADAVETQEELRRANEERLRVLADFQNFRRRARDEKRDAIRYGRETVLESLLPVLDNFERALAAGKEKPDSDALLQGVRLILKQLHEVLAEHGVHAIRASGQPFDPHRHEAVGRLETDQHPEGTVVEEVRKGYTHGDNVLRHSQVLVAAPRKK